MAAEDAVEGVYYQRLCSNPSIFLHEKKTRMPSNKVTETTVEKPAGTQGP